jgi:IS30 family transposase
MQQEQIAALFIAGESIDKISKRLGIHRDTVSTHVRAHGFEIKRGRPSQSLGWTLKLRRGLRELKEESLCNTYSPS